MKYNGCIALNTFRIFKYLYIKKIVTYRNSKGYKKGEIVMNKLWNWLNDTNLGRLIQSYVKVFAAVVLGLFLADGANVFEVSASDLKLWLAAGLSSVLPLLITILNPKDTRFGLTSKVKTVKGNNVYASVEKKEELMNPMPTVKKTAAKKVTK